VKEQSKVTMLEKVFLKIKATDNLKDELLPLLRERVFHLTERSSCASIMSDGAIKSNQHGDYPYTYHQSDNSFFRKKGCVSVFDLREVTLNEIDVALTKCDFLNPRFTENKPVFLFLSPLYWSQLLSWRLLHKEGAYDQMVIPHVEAGFPGEIPLSRVEEAMYVSIDCEQP